MTQLSSAGAVPEITPVGERGTISAVSRRWQVSALFVAVFAFFCAMWPLVIEYRYDRDYVVQLDRIALHGVLVLLVSFFMPRRANDPRSLFLYLAGVFHFIPTVAMGAMEGHPIQLSALFSVSMIGIALISLAKIDLAPRPMINVRNFMLLSALSGGLLLASFIYFVGLGVFNLDLSRVYDFRGESYDDLPLIARYMQTTYLYFLAPAACLLAYQHKQWIMGAVQFVIFALVMGFSNVKFPLAILFFVFLAHLGRTRGGAFMLLILLGVTALFTFIQWLNLNDEFAIFDLLIRRGALTRAVNNFAHYDLFQQINFVWWRDSRVTFGLFEQTYSVTIPYLVGQYLGFDSLAANAGWLASGYAQGGAVGVAVYSVVIGIVIAMVKQSRNRAPTVAICLGILMGSIFSEADTLTALLTGGVLPSVFIALFTTEMAVTKASVRAGRLMPWETRGRA